MLKKRVSVLNDHRIAAVHAKEAIIKNGNCKQMLPYQSVETLNWNVESTHGKWAYINPNASIQSEKGLKRKGRKKNRNIAMYNLNASTVERKEKGAHLSFIQYVWISTAPTFSSWKIFDNDRIERINKGGKFSVQSVVSNIGNVGRKTHTTPRGKRVRSINCVRREVVNDVTTSTDTLSIVSGSLKVRGESNAQSCSCPKPKD